jgi:hypothetical protein
MTVRNNGGCVTIREVYNSCYGACAAYACAVTSHNKKRSDAGRCFLYVRAEVVFSVLRGPCRYYKGDSLKEQERSKRNGIQRRSTDSTRMRTEFSYR